MIAFEMFKVFAFALTISAWLCVLSIFLKGKLQTITQKLGLFGLGFSAIAVLPSIAILWALEI